MDLHVLSYNVHWGLSTFRKHAVLGHLTRVIEETKADIVLLQELFIPNGQTAFILVDALRRNWPHQRCEPTVLLDKGEQGNGIFSRFSILESHHESFRYKQEQGRNFLHVRLEIPETGKILSVICTHFGLLRQERRFQADRLAHYVESRIDPKENLIIGGDFNDWRQELSSYWEARLNVRDVHFALEGRHAKSFPAFYPLFSVDRIYVRHLQIQSARVCAEAGWHGSSDHLPIATELVME